MFQPVDPKKSFPQLEHEMLDFWEKEKIFEKSLEQTKKQPKYVFFDGPPFANGLPHYGHILANALKDAVTRFWTMKGYYVPRVNGWDCHGLPVEYEIEKELKISGRKDIEKMGVAKFNNECRKSVFKYTNEWEKLLKRIARWVDFKNSYATLDTNYMESIWWVFKEIWKKGMVYQGFKTIHICPRCETPLSNFEVTLGYKDIAELSVYIKLKVKGEENTFILAWTTTPWTLPGNVALAVGENITYIKAKLPNGEKVIIGKDRKQLLGEEFEVLEEMKGKKLLGIEYEPLFDIKELQNEHSHKIIPADFVTTADGTGIVHTAGMYGEDDFNLCKANDIPLVHTVDEAGKFNKLVRKWEGLFVKSVDQKIAQDLEERGLLFKRETFRHSYPHCWRCETPLLNYSTKAWFIRVTDVKDKMIKNNAKIHWTPEHIKEGRFGKWLEGARDWNISRNRYWGCPIPVWECECGEKKCIGSVKELEEHSVGKKLPKREGELDLHKPYIDDIKLKCEKCGKEMQRIPEVLDCWFESGSMPYAQLHYPFENKKEFEDNFPANFIAEGVDQTRGWFYTLHVLATILFDKPAFRNVIVNGILLAADGEKLSKRKKNYPDPAELFEKHGADSTRFFLYSSTAPLAEDVRFSEKHVEEIVKKFTLTLWNTYSFFVTYANIDEWRVQGTGDRGLGTGQNKLDKWILSELNELTVEVSNAMEEYNLTDATRPMMDFMDNLSNWYIRRSRRRFWKSENDGDKLQAYQTLYTVLTNFCVLLAPFMPATADAIFKNLTGKESVHLEPWPKVNKKLVKKELNEEFRTVRTIVSLALRVRAKKNIKVRQPLAKLLLALPDNISQKLVESYKDVILEELNVKEIQFESEGALATYSISVDPRKIGPRFGAETQQILILAKKGDFAIQADGSVNLPKTGKPKWTLKPEEVLVGYKGKEGVDVESENHILVGLDTVITKELEQEGIVREIVRFLQELRKKSGYEISDRIYVYVSAPKEIQDAVTHFADFIKRETLAIELQEGGDFEWDKEEVLEIDGEKVKLGVRR